MTLLANEATGPSQRLLKKYGKTKAISFADLEKKLADLYFESGDKVQIEKDMADIHPHKTWLLSRVKPIEATKVEPVLEGETKLIEITPAPIANTNDVCTNQNCLQHHPMNNPYLGGYQNFSGESNNNSNTPKLPAGFEYIGMIGVLGIVAIGLILVAKATK